VAVILGSGRSDRQRGQIADVRHGGRRRPLLTHQSGCSVRVAEGRIEWQVSEKRRLTERDPIACLNELGHVEDTGTNAHRS